MSAISIHAPLAGCDRRLRHGRSLDIVEAQTDFNPRTPCGVRLIKNDDISSRNRFQSTHPLRGATNFHTKTFLSKIFQSTHPLRGATRINSMRAKLEQISIHAPLAGCDRRVPARQAQRLYFNPRTPCGVRLVRNDDFIMLKTFQSTHPLRGATDLYRHDAW